MLTVPVRARFGPGGYGRASPNRNQGRNGVALSAGPPRARFRDRWGSSASGPADPGKTRRPRHTVAVPTASPPRGSGVDLRPRLAAHRADDPSRSITLGDRDGHQGARGPPARCEVARRVGPREKDDPRLCVRMPADGAGTAAPNLHPGIPSRDTSARDATTAEAPRRRPGVSPSLRPCVLASLHPCVPADDGGGVARFTRCQFLAQSIFIFAPTVVT